jgi:hypothetical protein
MALRWCLQDVMVGKRPFSVALGLMVIWKGVDITGLIPDRSHASSSSPRRGVHVELPMAWLHNMK